MKLIIVIELIDLRKRAAAIFKMLEDDLNHKRIIEEHS